MYDPGAEHDACGVGMVTTLNKRPERKIIDDAIEVLINLNHRGAVGAEENTGDGAGILMSMPDEFMRATAGVELPEEGHYAAGRTHHHLQGHAHHDAAQALLPGPFR